VKEETAEVVPPFMSLFFTFQPPYNGKQRKGRSSCLSLPHSW